MDKIDNLSHIKLDRAHGDNGNTPRGIGSMLAVCDNFDAIMYLDADNWLEKDHAEQYLNCLINSGLEINEVGYIVGKRLNRGPKNEILKYKDEIGHYDTSEFMLLRNCFDLIRYWSLMPKQFGPICDRILNFKSSSSEAKYLEVEKPTINFLMRYAGPYELAGQKPSTGGRPQDTLGRNKKLVFKPLL